MKYHVVEEANGSYYHIATVSTEKLAIEEARSRYSDFTKHERKEQDVEIWATEDEGTAWDELNGYDLIPFKVYAADREAGTFIEEIFGTDLNFAIEQAKDLIEEWEDQDKENEEYTADFYDIVNENHESYLKRETREKRTERLHMKILPSLKQTAERNAKAEGRTLSNYIEKLIAEDEKRKAGK